MSERSLPTRPTVALVVGASRIVRELEDCEQQLERGDLRTVAAG